MKGKGPAQMSKQAPRPWTVDTLHDALNGNATKQQARLIAAAPELFTACSFLLARYEECVMLSGNDPELNGTIMRTRAALARARGGA